MSPKAQDEIDLSALTAYLQDFRGKKVRLKSSLHPGSPPFLNILKMTFADSNPVPSADVSGNLTNSQKAKMSLSNELVIQRIWEILFCSVT